jgi:hypothetical protein
MKEAWKKAWPGTAAAIHNLLITCISRKFPTLVEKSCLFVFNFLLLLIVALKGEIQIVEG